jgi:hypothetical protein
MASDMLSSQADFDPSTHHASAFDRRTRNRRLKAIGRCRRPPRMQKHERNTLHCARLQARGLMSLVLFLILLGAMGVTVFTQRSQAGFSRVSPTLAAMASHGSLPHAGVDGVPATVEPLIVALDGWRGDVIDPWQYIGTGMLQSSLNLRHLHRLDFPICQWPGLVPLPSR